MTGTALSVRITAGIRFPLLVFAVWRVVQAVVVLGFGGTLRESTYASTAAGT